MSKRTSSAKKSLIVSGLIGTGGMFAAKLIGLAYSIPFSYILSNGDYIAIYGQAYSIYSYMLTIFQSGIPFAVAALVARYMTLNDAKTVLLIKKLAFSLLGLMGFVGMLLMFFTSQWIAPLMVSSQVGQMAKTLQILSLAVFLVPLLSAFRGYYQGLKEMEEYAFSQAFEQIFRVAFLLGASCLFVYVLGWESKWALYVSVLSTSVAALSAIARFVYFDRKNAWEIQAIADKQKEKARSSKALLKEIAILAVPYLFVAVFGNIDSLFNSVLLPTGLRIHGYSEEVQTVITGAVTYAGTKLTAIPMILGPGFATAIIPHISSALVSKDHQLVKKHIKDCLNIVLFIALPVSFCIFAYAKPIYNVLFYTSDLDISASVVRWLAIEGFFGTITPLITNLMVALELRRNVVSRLAVCTLIKGITMIPLMWLFGFPGAVISSMLGYLYLIFMNLSQIATVYHVNYKNTIRVVISTCLAIFALFLTSRLLNLLGLYGIEGSKLICLVQLAINGIVSLAVFVIVALVLKIPQNVFHFRLKSFRKHGE